jgi:hypothetical protein
MSAKTPSAPEHVRQLALRLMQVNQLASARELLESALKLEAPTPLLLLTYGFCLQELGQRDQAALRRRTCASSSGPA